ncbi:MAG: response regulator [Sulfurimonas sp.]|nr:response regulator [Sulfurimonas sp.]
MEDMIIMLEHSKELNVLYVEDDIPLLKSTSALLSNFFKNTQTASDGEEGLKKYKKYYKKNGEYFDLVITDINMPKLDGVEMSRKILKINSLQSIVIATAHNEVEFLTKGLELGVDGFITKPIKNEQLIRVLSKATRVIAEHKFTSSHIEMVETLNLKLDEKSKLLEKQNKKLTEKNEELEKSFRLLNTMLYKEQVTSFTEPKEEKTSDSGLDDKYVQEQIENLVYDDLNELREIHTEIDNIIIKIINNTESIDTDVFEKLAKQFYKYSSILVIYSFFQELSASMKNFSITLEENPFPDNKESIKNIFMLLESFMYVLGKWQNDLALGQASNLNALDASMISDMQTITNMWTQKQDDLIDDDMDDIFDF